MIGVVSTEPKEKRPDDGGAARVLRDLGAKVVEIEIEDLPSRKEAVKLLLVDAYESIDLAETFLRDVRAVTSLTLPALLVLPERSLPKFNVATAFDDFLVRPFAPSELYARIRRLDWKTSTFRTDERIKWGDLFLDLESHRVQLGGVEVPLTVKEFQLLALFAGAPDRVFSREQILDLVWGSGYEGGERTVDVHVTKLRAKLGKAFAPEAIRGVGYRFMPEGCTVPVSGARPVATHA